MISNPSCHFAAALLLFPVAAEPAERPAGEEGVVSVGPCRFHACDPILGREIQYNTYFPGSRHEHVFSFFLNCSLWTVGTLGPLVWMQRGKPEFLHEAKVVIF